MNVKELIKNLNKEKNKEKEVYVFSDSEIYDIQCIDFGIDDRLDINIVDRENYSLKRKENIEILNEEELEQLRMDKEADFDDLRREIRDIYGEIEERKNKDNESLFSEEK